MHLKCYNSIFVKALLGLSVAIFITCVPRCFGGDIVVANVNGVPIYLSESLKGTPEFDSKRADAIDRQLIYHYFESGKNAVSNRVIDEKINNIISDEFGGSKPKFEEALKNSGSTLNQFVKAQKEAIYIALAQKEALVAYPNDPPVQAFKAYLKTLKSNAKIDLL